MKERQRERKGRCYEQTAEEHTKVIRERTGIGWRERERERERQRESERERSRVRGRKRESERGVERPSLAAFGFYQGRLTHE